MSAYDAYKAGNFDTALIKYYLLAELGYEAAQSNVAYILEKGKNKCCMKMLSIRILPLIILFN